MHESDVNELRGVLAAYKQVGLASWPTMHPTLTQRSAKWLNASPAELRSELDALLREASAPSCPVRVFWKLGDVFKFGGCNLHFARDAGMGSATELVGLDDFDKKIPWRLQAAKYRADDQEVFRTAAAKLDIVERQQATSGITWVRAGKAPIQVDGGVLGILGMYEILEAAEGRRLWMERLGQGSAKSARG